MKNLAGFEILTDVNFIKKLGIYKQIKGKVHPIFTRKLFGPHSFCSGFQFVCLGAAAFLKLPANS